jgi:hypothetical protein
MSNKKRKGVQKEQRSRKRGPRPRQPTAKSPGEAAAWGAVRGANGSNLHRPSPTTQKYGHDCTAQYALPEVRKNSSVIRAMWAKTEAA